MTTSTLPTSDICGDVEMSRTASVLRARAADLRSLADESHQLVAIAYRRRAAELELVASIADVRRQASSSAA